MLILTRKKGQSIILNNNIEIVISAIDGDQVKIGISAPKEVSILRKELYEEVQRSNKEAIRSKIDLDNLKKLMDLKKS
ncbi:carbon storage regulator CsrA [Paenibacillus chondroitinus]|uniref:Translational regulator CsrA n=1 Tax=Paenibacillus chondroitinus TaxID=59842 RepID=A0ABU6DBH9_9BACL|nr:MULTISPECIES: carbon storage regulator CsrA [Paenibacillus]MCY9660504.1 carbon storage regulator CsrA [Paenibacillus anseongense]MEB4795115.1 carbon storage regulator CsrA [Paenibacillus chondroitinus]